MIRRPDGYLFEQPISKVRTFFFNVYEFKDPPPGSKPVCLVPPELLDWVEHMRAILKLQPKPRIGDWDWLGLLDRLNTILPELEQK